MADTTVLAGVVTSAMCQGVLAEITGLLPTIIPVAISFIAIRKGIGFLLSTLRGA